MEKYLLIIILILHIVLLALVFLRLERHDVDYLIPLWAIFVPVFGPVSALIGIRIEAKGRDYTELRDFVGGIRKAAYNYRFTDTSDVLSAEEVLLINNVRDRRKAIMDIMQTEIKPYLEVLKLASSNDDMEVSHYATASIMQIQSDFQNGLNKLYAAVFSDEVTEEEIREYIRLLNEYIDSGLLNEALVYRQRLTMKAALEKAMQKFDCRDLIPVQVRNLIELGELAEAETICEKALSEETTEELAELRMKIYVLLKDSEGLRQYVKKLDGIKREFSPAFRDRIRFWQDHKEDQVKVPAMKDNKDNKDNRENNK